MNERSIERNRYDTTGENLNRGLTAEKKFIQIAHSKGYKVCLSNPNQDMNEHWDYELSKDGKSFKVEVKAMKKIKRSDPTPQDKYAWIELHGVREWDEGWLYGGKSDYIAFETRNSFILVGRKRLIDYINTRLSEEIVSRPEDALVKDVQGKYRRYRRRTHQKRSDEMILMEMDVLRSLCWEEWFF